LSLKETKEDGNNSKESKRQRNGSSRRSLEGVTAVVGAGEDHFSFRGDTRASTITVTDERTSNNVTTVVNGSTREEERFIIGSSNTESTIRRDREVEFTSVISTIKTIFGVDGSNMIVPSLGNIRETIGASSDFSAMALDAAASNSTITNGVMVMSTITITVGANFLFIAP